MNLSGKLHVWKFHADFADPGNTTFEGPVDVSIAPFDALDCGNPNLADGCVPQGGSSQLLQAHPNVLAFHIPHL